MINLLAFHFHRIYTKVIPGDEDKYIIFLNSKNEVLITKIFGNGDEHLYAIEIGDYDTIISNLRNYTYVALKDLVRYS